MNINVNISNNNGDTPILIATRRGFKGSVQVLLTANANPFIKNNDEVCAIDELKNNTSILSKYKHYFNNIHDVDYEIDIELLKEVNISVSTARLIDNAIKLENIKILIELIPELYTFIKTNTSSVNVEENEEIIKLKLTKVDKRKIAITYE